MKYFKNVYFHWFLSKDKLYDVLNTAKIIILPSRTEAYNQAILEWAMLWCIPISTNVWAAKDVIFESWNIIEWITEDELINKFIERIIYELNNPSIDPHQLIKIYKKFWWDKNKIKRFNYIKNIINDKTKPS